MMGAWFTQNAWYIALLGFAREDVRQTYKLCNVIIERTGEDRRTVQRREFWRLARDLGVSSAYQGRYIPEELEAEFIRIEPESQHHCVLCGKPAPYKDRDWGRLCRRHAMTVRGRRKRYQQWLAGGCIGRKPKHPLDAIPVETELPRRNRSLWEQVRKALSREEWETLWQWARGRYVNRPDKIIQKAREIILGTGQER